MIDIDQYVFFRALLSGLQTVNLSPVKKSMKLSQLYSWQLVNATQFREIAHHRISRS
jgi:hypothetical protein